MNNLVKRLRATQCCDPVIDSMLGAAIEEIERLEKSRERLFDLVRYQRHTLFNEELIDRDEYSVLLTDPSAPGSVERLESYDEVHAKIRAKIENLEEKNREIRSRANVAGDNLCWIIDDAVARALPEREFLESCRRHRAQIAAERGELRIDQMTIAQLETRVTELETKLRDLEKRP